jgi:hypothetical protein
MKKLLAIMLITAAALGLGGCVAYSCDEPYHPRHARVVYVPPRPPPPVVVVPGPEPHHHPPAPMHRGD